LDRALLGARSTVYHFVDVDERERTARASRPRPRSPSIARSSHPKKEPPMPRTRHAFLCLFVPPLAAALACASTPPPTSQISAAELAIRQAESVGAVELAPLPMRIAREKLDEAKSIVSKGANDQLHRAKRLAESAAVEAQLAEQTARTETAKKNRDEARRTIDTMRREAGLD